MASSKKKLHLKTMEKRKAFLLSLKGTPKYNSWIAQELGATQYAIELMTEKVEEMQNTGEVTNGNSESL